MDRIHPGPSDNPSSRRCVVLDRDGTIIVEKNYLSAPDQVELLPGAAEGLKQMSAMGLGLVVVSNQSGIGRGYFTESRLQEVHQRMSDLLASHDVYLDAIYHCPHTPENGCACRKPRTGLLDRAANDCRFDPATCFVVGDKESDIKLGQGVGATTILVTTGYGKETAVTSKSVPDFTVDGLQEASQAILMICNSVPESRR